MVHEIQFRLRTEGKKITCVGWFNIIRIDASKNKSWNVRLYLSFVLRLFCYFCNISTVFWWYSFSDHRVGLLCVLFGFVGPISFQLKLETFQTKWRTFIIKPLPFYSVSFRVSDVPVGRILDRLFFSFLVLFYFPLSILFFYFLAIYKIITGPFW